MANNYFSQMEEIMEMALNELEKELSVRGEPSKYAIPESSTRLSRSKLLTIKSSRKLKKGQEPEMGTVTEEDCLIVSGCCAAMG